MSSTIGLHCRNWIAIMGWVTLWVTCVSAEEPGAKPAAANPLDANTIRLVFVGDIMLDNGPGHVIGSGNDPFVHCRDVLLQADLTIGNLECVVGRGGEQMLKPYVFRAANKSEQSLKPYFDAVSLANNHTFDFGEEGIRESLRVLANAGIPNFGAGHSLAEARRPLVLECKGRKVGLLGYNEFFAEDYAATDTKAGNAPLVHASVLADIEQAKSVHGCDIVIPFVHWGEELVATPREDQRAMAQAWIDAGASAVVGAHPHIVQTVDVYHGAPIVYSLGNFVFDYYPPDPPEWIGWILTLDIDLEKRVSFTTTPVTMDAAGIPHLIDPDTGYAKP